MEANAAIETAKHVLIVFGVVLAFGMLAALLAKRLKMPDVAVLLLIGIAVGPAVAGLVDIKADSALNQVILIFGSCYILFDGGASLRLKVLKQVWITIVVISTIGVLITATITGLAAYYFLEVPLIVAMLLGACIASTDPATLVPIFKQVPIKDRVAQTVMSESAFNDAMGAIVTFTILGVAMGSETFSLGHSAFELCKQAGLGILVGGILGYAAAFLIGHDKYDFLVEYAPLVTLMAVIGAYMEADSLSASGFMAVFVFGIILGNQDAFGFKMDEVEHQRLEEFITTTALIMRMFIFILLGAQVDFALMNKYLVGGAAVVAVMMLVARPLTVFLCAGPDRRSRWSLKELLFMCWTRETGVIPAALAGLLLGMKAPGAEMIASVTFVAVLMTILIQAPTTAWLARRLGLLLNP
ncbi:MAG: cation:proton antiporter [Candidatus Accumulibacter sp.]|nr:cation:proton antiporter [Accumulibacter sp.]